MQNRDFNVNLILGKNMILNSDLNHHTTTNIDFE